MQQNQPQKMINWELPLDQAQFILNQLSTLPFKDVSDLIGTLIRQSQPKTQQDLRPVETKRDQKQDKEKVDAAS